MLLLNSVSVNKLSGEFNKVTLCNKIKSKRHPNMKGESKTVTIRQ